MTIEDEFTRLQLLNLELAETLSLAAVKLMLFAEKNNVCLPEREALAHLLKRAASILNEIRQPYFKTVVEPSDASYHDRDEDQSDDNLPVPSPSNA